MNEFRKVFLSLPVFILLTMPASSNYELKGYDFGGGGGVGESASYTMEAITGEVNGAKPTSASYGIFGGLLGVQQANVPAAPTFTNNSGIDYNKLKFVINNGDNPSDATFAIAISTDNFATTQYVQADDTIGSSIVYQTYSNWGGGTGEFVIGLIPNTTYYLKVKANTGLYTESPYSAVSSAATSAVTMTFDIDVSSDCSETAPPYVLNIGDLTPGSVVTGTNKICLDITTNAISGASIYINDSNTGLKSGVLNNTITSATADLSSAGSGYGMQGASKTQTSGGPLEYVAPFNGTSDNVGGLSPTLKQIFNSTDAPITGGKGSINVKAKASSTTPAATDYTDTVTLVAAGNF